VQSYQQKQLTKKKAAAFWSLKEYLQSVGFCGTHQASEMDFLFEFFFHMKLFVKLTK